MKILSDGRGFAIIFESEMMLDRTIDHLRSLRDWKRKNNKEYPAVFTYTSEKLPGQAGQQLHDEAFWMGFAVQGKPQPGDPGSGPREDS